MKKVYKNSWSKGKGEFLSSYIHNPSKEYPFLGKIGSLIKVQAEDASKVEKVEAVAKALSMHIAAMKPNYLGKNEVPQEVKDKAMEIGKEKGLRKLYETEVLYDQELALCEESKSVK